MITTYKITWSGKARQRASVTYLDAESAEQAQALFLNRLNRQQHGRVFTNRSFRGLINMRVEALGTRQENLFP